MARTGFFAWLRRIASEAKIAPEPLISETEAKENAAAVDREFYLAGTLPEVPMRDMVKSVHVLVFDPHGKRIAQIKPKTAPPGRRWNNDGITHILGNCMVEVERRFPGQHYDVIGVGRGVYNICLRDRVEDRVEFDGAEV